MTSERVKLNQLDIHGLFEHAADGDKRCLGRLISLVERQDIQAGTIAELAQPKAGQAHIIGVTGPPGSGKSTLMGQLMRLISKDFDRSAVLAVDPSSPLTGGAILGDRVRMEGVASPDTFIRSMATRGHQGGLALAVPGVLRVLDACGYNPIVIETVGVGQVEVDVTGSADTTVVVATPGMGDGVQANKAGLLELADLFVVNKSDLAGADTVRRDLELMLDLSHATGHDQLTGPRPEIVMTSALTGDGAAEMWAAIRRHHQTIEASGQLRQRRQRRDRSEVRQHLLAAAESYVDQLLDSPKHEDLLKSIAARSLAPPAAAAKMAEHLRGAQ